MVDPVARVQVAHLIEGGTRLAHPLVTPVVRIGRDPASDILVRDATVSRLHAEVRLANGVRTLSIPGSTGGRVNEARVEAPVMLRHGDVVELGIRQFTYHEGELPAGIMSYVGHGQEAQGDDLLSRTTQSNPVIRPHDLSRESGGPWGFSWTNVAIVAAAFCFGCCIYLAGAPR